MSYNRKEKLLNQVAVLMKELEVEPEVFALVRNSVQQCLQPRRDGTPCYWCVHCFERFKAEKAAGIKHDLAIEKMIEMYQEIYNKES